MPQPVGIGIDIGENQIRVARLRHTSRGLEVQGLGAAPTPSGAMSGASVLEPRLLADGIRRALRTANISGVAAVVGLPGRAASSRVLELPAMAKEEMKTVVAGEMEHHRMIAMGQGTFDFLTLTEPQPDSRRVRVLVMAADKKLVDDYREALRLAGLQLLALEPVSLAAARAVYPALQQGGVALITVGARSTEFTVFCNGVLRYSRQIDVGVLDILGGQSNAHVDATAAPVSQPAPVTAIPTLERSGGNLQTLLFELQRSLDFYHREAPDSERVERLLLSVDPTHVQALDQQLQTSLGLPVTMCDPFADLNAGAASDLNPAFAPALGLARRLLEENPGAPQMDLSITGRASRLAKVAPRYLTWATVVSLVVVFGGMLLLLQVYAAMRHREAQLGQAKAELVKVSADEQVRTSEAKHAQEAQRIVQLRGLPWSDILFNVSSSMPEGVWLTSVTLAPGNSLALDGMALSANSVATLMEALTHAPLFRNPEMTSLQKNASGASSALVKYQVKVQLVVPPPAGAAAAPAPAGTPASPPPTAPAPTGGAL